MLKSLTDEEYTVLLNELRDAQPRNRAMILLALHGGLRNGEICALNFRDLFLGSTPYKSLEITNGHKGRGKVRMIPVTETLSYALKEYHSYYSKRYGPPRDSDPAFVTLNQRGRIQPRDIQRICANITRVCLGKSIHPHALRHTFATRLMRRTNIRVVQQLLGHRSITSTQVYTHPSTEDCVDAITKTF